MASELIPEPPALLFDNIVNYPPGFRVLSLHTGSRVRMAVALGLPTDTSKIAMLRKASSKIKNASLLAPEEFQDGPVMQNVMRGEAVDMLAFPSLHAHRLDGGRYIGTAV